MIIRSKAPFRISFGGGGTDVPPYCWDYGGVVVSTTIDKYTFVTLKTNNTHKISIHSIDFGLRESFTLGRLEYNGNLDLVKAVINEYEVKEGFDLVIHADAPPRSGMGTSSCLAVALIGCLNELTGRQMNVKEIAELAYHIEREELKEKGGYQDQYAAAFGGFNFMEFNKKGVKITPLNLSAEILNELEYRLLLFYTGTTRFSSKIHEDMAKNYEEKQEDYCEALHGLKRIADDMRRCLVEENLSEFGELLHHGWILKRKLSKEISNSEIDKLYDVARKKGAVGGKLLGAGGGGHLLLFCEPDKRFDVIQSMNECGVKFVPFRFESKGLQTWRVK